MKPSIILLAGLLGLIAFPGCYTQLATTHDDDAGYSSPAPDQQAYDTTYNGTGGGGDYYDNQNGYYDDQYGGYWHPHYGFSYYYPGSYWPSVGFGWQYDNLWSFYGGYYYDPWVCGTPYVTYPAIYGGAFYYPSYYYPAYYHHGYAYNGVNGYNSGRAVFVNRPIGAGSRGTTTRVGSGDRGGYAPAQGAGAQGTNFDLPRGARVDQPVAGPSRGTSAPGSGRVATAPRGTSGSRDGQVARQGGRRGSGSRVGAGTRGSNRGTAPGRARQYRYPDAPSAPSGSSSGAPQTTQRAPSSAPPRASAPAPSAHPRSAPAPSSGGGRGNDGRGRRP